MVSDDEDCTSFCKKTGAIMRRMIFLAAAFFLISQTVAAQVQLRIPAVYGAPGSNVIVPVMLSEGKDIAAIQLDITFDANVLSIPSDESVMAGELVTNHGLLINRESDRLRVTLFSGSLSTLKPGSGCLTQVVFQVGSGASAGSTTAITIAASEAANASAAIVPLEILNGSLTVANTANEPAPGQNELIFPQIANGDAGGAAHYGTTLILMNRTDASAAVKVTFTSSSGSPFVVTLPGVGSSSTFSLSIPGKGSICLVTDGAGPLATGYARVASTAPLGGSILFSLIDATGIIATEAGVGSSLPGTDFSIPVLSQPGVMDMGIAVANPSSIAVDVTLRLLDAQGKEMAAPAIVKLSANGQKAWYATESFPVLASQSGGFSGSMRIGASTPVSAIAIRGTFSGRYGMTTFPVIAK
jgi:hypothetical protein